MKSQIIGLPMAQLNIALPYHILENLAAKSAKHGISVPDNVRSMIFAYLGLHYSPSKGSFLEPLEPAPGWNFEIEGRDTDEMLNWLKDHDITSLNHIWNEFYQAKRGRAYKESVNLDKFLRRNGWYKSSGARDLRIGGISYGRAAIYKMDRNRLLV